MGNRARALIGWWPVAIIVVALLILFGCGMAGNARDRQTASDQEITLNLALYNRNQEKTQLENAVEQVGTKSYVEREARTSLGYLKDGEIRFRVVNPEDLSKYTAEEHQIYINEKRLDSIE